MLARRGFFVVLGFLTTIALGKSPVGAAITENRNTPNPELRLFDNPAAARAVGRAYLREYPDDADAARLTAERAALLCGGRIASTPERTIWVKRRIASHMKRDFCSGNTVAVQGWILSRTEARLYASLCLT